MQSDSRSLAPTFSLHEEGLPASPWDLDPRNERVHYPVGWTTRLGCTPQEDPGSTRTWRSRVLPEDLPGMLGALQAHLEGWSPFYESRFRLRDANGHYRPVLSRGQVLERAVDGRALRMTGSMTELNGPPVKMATMPSDLPADRAAILDTGLVGVLTVQRDRIAWTNLALSALLQYPATALPGRSPRILFHDQRAYTAFAAAQAAALRSDKLHRTRLEMRRADRTPVWVDIASTAHPLHRDVAIWRLIDISDHREQWARVEHLAQHDALTGLPNRRLLAERLTRALAGERRRTSNIAACYIDLDGFKQVNDTLGHDAGDRLLRDMATRMGQSVRRHDTLARIGGDEFALLLAQPQSRNEALRVLHRLLAAIGQEVDLGTGRRARMAASIGVVFCSDSGASGDALLAEADRAMFVAKRGGGGRIEVGHWPPEQSDDGTRINGTGTA